MLVARNTIVFLTSDYSDYAKLTAELVSVVAADAGYGTLCVTGRELAPDLSVQSEQAVCNRIYRLIERVNAAGLICESGMLGHQAGAEAVFRFLADINLPCVSLGMDIPGRPSVITDDASSMGQLMEHLVSDSQRQHFAFVRGIPEDMYSIERESIFRNMLSRYDREIDESLFVNGNYDIYESYDAVANLLCTHDRVDAIVCANDMMALSSARAATAAGLSIPGDIVVSGFDDVPDATRHSPALTTVRQPLVEMTELAMAKLLRLIHVQPDSAGISLPENNPLSRVSSELVIRGSTIATVHYTGKGAQIEPAEINRMLDAGMTGLKSPDYMDLCGLARALDHTIKHSSSNLADYLKPIVTQISHTDTHWWSNLCHQIVEISKGLLLADDHSARMPFVEAALGCIRERVWALEMEREFTARRVERMRSSMQLKIGSSTGIDDTLNAIDSWIHRSDPQRFYLVCYDKPSSVPRPKGRLLRAYHNAQVQSVSDKMFDTSSVLPEAFADQLQHGTLLLNPVYAGSDHFGYLMIDPEGLDVSQIDSAARSIGNAMRSHYLIEQMQSQAIRLQKANEELSKLANCDALTGLANRFHFEHRLRDLCRSGGNNQRFALCFLDLDGFKKVNDLHGHETGDSLLKVVSERLGQVVADIVGDHGFVSRLGGDEFTVILDSPHVDNDLERLAPALLSALSERYSFAGQQVQVSASIGAAVYPDNGYQTAELLKCADTAMYQAKSLGKNRFVLYSEEGNHFLSARIRSQR